MKLNKKVTKAIKNQRTILLILLLILILQMFSAVSLAKDKGKVGDINNDGYIDTADARMILQYFAGEIILTKEQMILADVNNDGMVRLTDLRIILLYYVGQTQI